MRPTYNTKYFYYLQHNIHVLLQHKIYVLNTIHKQDIRSQIQYKHTDSTFVSSVPSNLTLQKKKQKKHKETFGNLQRPRYVMTGLFFPFSKKKKPPASSLCHDWLVFPFFLFVFSLLLFSLLLFLLSFFSYSPFLQQ